MPSKFRLTGVQDAPAFHAGEDDDHTGKLLGAVQPALEGCGLPHFTVSTVVEGENGDRWREIGVAFQSEKGSITVLLDALPVSAKLILTVPRERPQQGSAPSRTGC